MKLINLTSTPLTIKSSSGKKFVIPPSGEKIQLPDFVLEKSTTYPNFFRVEENSDKYLIEKKIARLFWELPPKKKQTIYIVDLYTLSLITLFTHRSDFMFVAESFELCVLQRKKQKKLNAYEYE